MLLVFCSLKHILRLCADFLCALVLETEHLFDIHFFSTVVFAIPLVFGPAQMSSVLWDLL
jgi:hypothetical protein